MKEFYIKHEKPASIRRNEGHKVGDVRGVLKLIWQITFNRVIKI